MKIVTSVQIKSFLLSITEMFHALLGKIYCQK